MQLDGRNVAGGRTLETEVCIVGAGPAGLVLASELIAGGIDVIVLESGAARGDTSAQALNDGDLSGDAYAGLIDTRHRGVGGTTLIWNTLVAGAIAAKYIPLDPVDLRAREVPQHTSWPIAWNEMLQWYGYAHALCGLGAFDYSAEAARGALEPLSLEGTPLTSRIYRAGSRAALVDARVTSLRVADTARLCRHATVTALERGTRGDHVDRLHIASPGGTRWYVSARTFVLACGAVENARLLLLGGEGRLAPGNAGDMVGRCFMEHPRDLSLTLYPSRRDFVDRAGFYDLREMRRDEWVLGRLALEAWVVRENDLPNASITLLPRTRAALVRARRYLDRIPGAGGIVPPGGHGWSARRRTRLMTDGVALLVNLEQSPHPENRVTLGARYDAFGTPLPSLQWRFRDDDRTRLERLRAIIVESLEGTGTGRVERRGSGIDPNAHHHAGTTRMHSDPRHGVVDADCRVHGTENLYVTGASVLPTSGFANPLLTIVALAARLAAHLRNVAPAL